MVAAWRQEAAVARDDVSVEVVKVVADALTDAVERVSAAVGSAVGDAVRAALAPPEVAASEPVVDHQQVARERWERARDLEDPTDTVPWLSGVGLSEPSAAMGPALDEDRDDAS